MTVFGYGLSISLRRTIVLQIYVPDSKLVLPGSTVSHLFRNSCSGCSNDQSSTFQSSGALKMANTSSFFLHIYKNQEHKFSVEIYFNDSDISAQKQNIHVLFWNSTGHTSKKASPPLLCIFRTIFVLITEMVQSLKGWDSWGGLISI